MYMVCEYGIGGRKVGLLNEGNEMIDEGMVVVEGEKMVICLVYERKGWKYR